MDLPLNINFQQIFLHLFNFVILMLGLYLLLYRPVHNFMQKRLDHYAEQEQQANRLKAEAQALKADYEQQLARCQSAVDAVKEEEMEKLTRESQQILDLAKAEAVKIKAEAEKDAAMQRERIKESSRSEIAKMVVAATEKLMLKNRGKENDLALYDSFLGSAEEGAEDHGDEG